MSQTVDRRIVEMRFDNKDFENNVGDTLISLETLKKALEMQGGSKGLENIQAAANNVDMSGIQNGVEETQRRFSAMEVVAITVLANITNSAVNAGKRIISSFMSPLISGGKQRAMNMAQAKFMFAGLGYAEKEIGSASEPNTIMGRIYKGVEGTFYSLDRAALVASQLMASGMKGTSEELTKTLKAVAGISSMFGADYDRVGQIFSKIRATNKAMGGDLTDLSMYGVPAAQKIADYLNEVGNTSEYTQEKIQDMAAKGKIDFETFSKAFESYGEQAAKSKQLFTGAFEDMVAAMARVGEKVWAPILNLEKDFLNAVVPLIDNFSAKITPALNLFGSFVDGISKKLASLVDIVAAFFDYDATLEALEALVKSDVISSDRIKILESYKSKIDSVRDSINNILKPIKTFREAVSLLFKNNFSNDATVRAYELGVSFEKLMIIKKVGMAFQSASKFISNFSKAIGALVSKDFSETAYSMASGFGLTIKEINYLKDIFNGITSVINIFKNAFSTVIQLITDGLFKLLGGVFDNTSKFRLFFDVILSALAAIGRFLSGLETPFKSTFSLLSDVIRSIASILSTIGGSLKGYISSIISTLKGLGESFDNIGVKAAEALGQILEFGGGAISTVFHKLAESLGGVGKVLVSLFKGVTAGALVGGLWNIAKSIEDFFQKIRESGMSIGIGEVFNETRLTLIKLQMTLEVYQRSIKANIILKIAIAIGILAASVKLLSTINTMKLAEATAAIAVLFDRLIFAVTFMKIGATTGIIQMAVAVRILAGAVKTVGDMKAADIAKGVGAIGALLELMVLVSEKMAIISKTKTLNAGAGASFAKNILPIIGMAVVIKMLVKPIKELGSMDIGSLAKGLVAVGLLLAGLTGSLILFEKYLNTSVSRIDMFLGAKGQIYSLVFALVMLAAGINLLAKPVKDLGALSLKSLEKGLGSVGIMLAEIITFITIFDALQIENPTSLLKVGGMMIMLGVAMKLISEPVQALAKLNAKQLIKGLGSMGIMLAEIVVFAGFMNAFAVEGAAFIKAGAALAIMAIGMKILASALDDLSSIGDVGTGLSVMFGSLVILAGALLLMQNALPGAAALAVAAVGLSLIAPPLALLSTLNFGGVVIGLIALAGALALLGAAGFIVSVLPGIAIGLLLLGTATALVGVGVLALASGITMLATAFAVGAEPIIAGAKIIAEAFPVIAKGLADGIVACLDAIGNMADSITKAFVKIMNMAISALYEVGPKFINAGLYIIEQLLAGINRNIGQITVTAISIIVNFINALGSQLPAIVQAGYDLMVDFCNALADGITNNSERLTTALLNVILAAIGAMAGLIPGFGKSGQQAIDRYRKAIQNGQSPSRVAAKNVADTVNKNLKVKDQQSNGRNAVQGLINGLGSLTSRLKEKARNIADIVDGIIRKRNEVSSPSKRLFRTGKYLMQGLIGGVDSLTGQYEKRAENISTTMIDSASKTADQMSNIMNRSLLGGFDISNSLNKAANIDVSLRGIVDRNTELSNMMERLSGSLDGMVDTMNSRSLNNYINITGNEDPNAFADALTRRFKLNVRTM